MSRIVDLLNVVMKESFTPEMEEMGNLANSEYIALKERLAESEAINELFRTASQNAGDRHMYSDEEEAFDALNEYEKKHKKSEAK